MTLIRYSLEMIFGTRKLHSPTLPVGLFPFKTNDVSQWPSSGGQALPVSPVCKQHMQHRYKGTT